MRPLYKKLAILCFFFLACSTHLKAQDTAHIFPRRYFQVDLLRAPAGVARAVMEWKKDAQHSHCLALNAFINENWFEGAIVEVAKRHYRKPKHTAPKYKTQKHRWYLSYHAGLGYVQRVMRLRSVETITPPGSPPVSYATTEITYKKHSWVTGGIGGGIGWQRPLGKRKRWVADIGVGVQFYYFKDNQEKNERHTQPDGTVVETTWQQEIDLENTIWKHPLQWGSISPDLLSFNYTPFSIPYLNIAIGHSF